jgi:type VI secretion system secreted protein VgrG
MSRQHSHANNEIFDYAGDYVNGDDGAGYARARIEADQAQYELVSGAGDTRGLAVGGLFKLTDFPREDQNREYLIVSATHELISNEYESVPTAELTPVYTCSFKAIESKVQYRSPRITRKPFVQGPQTAVVVGKSGEDIWTDKYGRVKVQFHWDRYGKNDENSSCWVRVSHPWAGKNWGAIAIPRIGQEVIVDFLEGDPDRPVITGRVYNADQMPPYALPDNMTQTGILTRTTKEGNAKTCNELRFEDKKDAEEIYLHAEKDMNVVVENNATLKVGFDKKDPGDQKIDVYKNRTVTIDQGNDKLQIKTGNRDVLIDTGNHTVSIAKGNDKLDVGTGNREVIVSTGNHSLSIKTGNQTTKIDLGKSSLEAMQSIELKVGGNSVKIDQTGVTIKGIMVTIEGTAKADIKSPMTSVNGDGMVMVKGGIVMIN